MTVFRVSDAERMITVPCADVILSAAGGAPIDFCRRRRRRELKLGGGGVRRRDS